MNDNRKYTLITGGSRGIGFAMARECAGRGMNLLLVAKVGDGMDAATKRLREEFPKVDIQSRKIDLREPDGPQQVFDWCREEDYRVDMLINNAGVAGTAEFSESDPSYNDERILVNIRALVLLTRLFLPEMKTYSRSYILNIGSFSAYYSIPFKAVYSASKTFVNSFTRALKHELTGSSVHISVVHPNGVRTNPETHGRIDTHSKLTRKLLILDASEIACISLDGLLKGKTVLIPGFFNRLVLKITLLLPRGFRERRTARIFRKELLGTRE